jgi:hypothetical protein
MNRKIILSTVCTIVVLGIGLSIVQNMQDSSMYYDVFAVDAVFYPDKKIVEITYDDNTEKTTRVVLEILGMEPSFQKTFDTFKFSLAVPFDDEPKYGWRSMPVTFVVYHEDYGKVGIKIDIHNAGSPAGNAIFSRL